MEEQKSKDFFKREIKEEIDDSSQDIKKETLDEEHFEQNYPKFEEVVEPCQQSDLSFFNMSNDQISNSSSQIFKQEPVWSEPSSDVAMEDVKIEPIDHFEDNLDTQMHLNPAIKEKPRRVKEKPRRVNHCCSVCSQSKLGTSMKAVHLVHDKLIIMITLVLRGEFTLVKAQLFMSEKKHVFICFAHFPEALNEIYSALCIQNFEDSLSCSPQFMKKLMLTVNAILPKLRTSEFCNMLKNFNKRNQDSFCMEFPSRFEQVNEPSTQFMPHQDLYSSNTQPVQIISNGESSSGSSQIFVENIKQEQRRRMINSNSGQYKSRCAVCFELKNTLFLKHVTMENDQLVVMIGCVLRGEYTIRKAQLFMSKYRIYICYTHFSEAFNAICNALHIQNPNYIFTCSVRLMKNLMSIVNALCPQLKVSDFLKLLKNVSVRNKDYIQMPVMDLILEEQALMILNGIQINYTTPSNVPKRHCPVCSLLRNGNSLKRVTVEDDKLMIMVGCILRGEYTIERAKLFMSMGSLFSCRNHYRETIDEICKALDIQNHNRIYMSSPGLMENLMEIVNALYPQFTIQQFLMCLTCFAARNEHFGN